MAGARPSVSRHFFPWPAGGRVVWRDVTVALPVPLVAASLVGAVVVVVVARFRTRSRPSDIHALLAVVPCLALVAVVISSSPILPSATK